MNMILEVHPDELREEILKYKELNSNPLEEIDIPESVRHSFLAKVHGKDGYQGGVGITRNNELVALFSLHKGVGKDLINVAVHNGADYLKCFDGKLVKYYEQFGFKEYAREGNYELGGPDIIYMSLRNSE